MQTFEDTIYQFVDCTVLFTFNSDNQRIQQKYEAITLVN